MRFKLFLGCNIPARVKQYQDSADAVCRKLGIQLETSEQFMCCGYPMRNIDEFVFLVCAARNMAISEMEDKEIMVLCKCCYGSLKTAFAMLQNDSALKQKVNQILKKDGLYFSGKIAIKHFLSVLYEDVGIDRLSSSICFKYEKLKIAASVGCHALRPARVTGFDNPANPSLFDTLVRITGAKPVEWSKKSDCCGAPLLGINDSLSKQIMRSKVANAIQNKADFMAVACPYSFLQFDTLQKKDTADQTGHKKVLAPVLYPQLLGLTMGIDAQELGLNANQMKITSLESYLSRETENA